MFLASLGPQPIPRHTVRYFCSSPNSITQPSSQCSPGVTLTVQSQHIVQCSDVLPLLPTQTRPLPVTLPSFPKSHLHSNVILPETKRTVYQPLELKYSNFFPASKCILSSLITYPFTPSPTLSLLKNFNITAKSITLLRFVSSQKIYTGVSHGAMFDPEDESTRIFRNTRTYRPKNATPHTASFPLVSRGVILDLYVLREIILAVLAGTLTEVKRCVKVPLGTDPFIANSNEMRRNGSE